jgi:hypothetical protein
MLVAFLLIVTSENGASDKSLAQLRYQSLPITVGQHSSPAVACVDGLPSGGFDVGERRQDWRGRPSHWGTKTGGV